MSERVDHNEVAGHDLCERGCDRFTLGDIEFVALFGFYVALDLNIFEPLRAEMMFLGFSIGEAPSDNYRVKRGLCGEGDAMISIKLTECAGVDPLGDTIVVGDGSVQFHIWQPFCMLLEESCC